MKRTWVTNEHKHRGKATIVRLENQNPKWRGRLVLDDPGPTSSMSQAELIEAKMVGIYRVGTKYA